MKIEQPYFNSNENTYMFQVENWTIYCFYLQDNTLPQLIYNVQTSEFTTKYYGA